MRFQIQVVMIAAGILIVALMMALPNSVRAEPRCTCRYAGERFELASCACMKTPSGLRMACCNQVLNNPSWTFTSRSCPIANAGDHIPSLSTQPTLIVQLGAVVNQIPWLTVTE